VMQITVEHSSWQPEYLREEQKHRRSDSGFPKSQLVAREAKLPGCFVLFILREPRSFETEVRI
jgi:hypothetical protein